MFTPLCTLSLCFFFVTGSNGDIWISVFGPHRQLPICYSNFLTDLPYNHCFQSSAHRMSIMTWCTLSLIIQFGHLSCLNVNCPTPVSATLLQRFVETPFSQTQLEKNFSTISLCLFQFLWKSSKHVTQPRSTQQLNLHSRILRIYSACIF